ncbi:MAG TPA: DUF4082 domain-containing protein [Pyrinomonadaceae bacterium]|nr:DUF4082 domain-containing protein [Pyrinomonadaceae bacterium]
MAQTLTGRVLIACFVLCFTVALCAPVHTSGLAATGTGSTAARRQADPSIVGQWSAPMSWPAIAVHAHLLPNGRVLFWGRDQDAAGDVDNKTQTYIWNPANGAITTISNLSTNMFCSGHAFLHDGRLLVSGGHDKFDGAGEPHTNIFNFNNNTWTSGAAMNLGRWYPTSTTLSNGEVLTVSGTYWDGTFKADGSRNLINNSLPQAWQNTGGWRSLTTAQQTMLGAGRSLSLYPFMFLAPDGRVFNAGPEQATSFFSTAGTGGWADAGRVSNFGYRDSGSAVMYDNGKVLIVGGGSPTNTAEIIDLNTANGWQYVNPMVNARRHLNSTVLPDGKVLVTGGTSSPGFNDATGSVLAPEMWDPATWAWTTMASMAVRRLYHSTALLLPDGRVLSAGGGGPASPNAGDTDHRDAELYSPPYLFKGARPTITSAPTNVKYGETFFVQTPDAGTVSKVTWVRLSSVTHSFNQNQRFSRLTFSQASGGLNVAAPSNKNWTPPGHYMLFILNANGVPSVAKIVSIQDYEGFVDGTDCGQVWGWAWNKNDPNTAINVDIYDGNTYLATVAANQYRQDLVNAGKGNGFHAFGYTIPAALRNGQVHQISVRFAGSYSNLSSSPRSIACGAVMFPTPPGTVNSVSGGGQTWEQATQFSSNMSGQITHIRYYKVPEESGSHVGRIWSDTGVPLAQANFINETASGWQEAALSTPLQITAGVKYRVSYNVNFYGAKIVGFFGPAVTNGPLTAHAAMYATPSGTYPNTGSVSNFLADIRFSAP